MTAPTAPPRWNRETKILATVIALLVFVALAYLARNVITVIALAGVVAYVFQPAVGWLERRRIPRGMGAALCLLLLVVLLALVPVLLTPAIVDGVRSIIDVLIRLPELFQQWATDLAENQPVLSIAGFTLDMTAAFEEFQASLTETVGEIQLPSLSDLMNYLMTGVRTAGGIVQTAVGIASSVVSAALSTLLLAVLIYFLTKDGRQLGVTVKNLVLPAYQPEVEELGRRLDVVWKSFFRGQIVLSLVVGFVVFLSTALLGLPGALVLGILAGLLEVIPNMGPVLALIPAVLVALVQGSNLLPVSNLIFAVIVVLVYIVIQQVENNYLVPRIMGHSLNLHPVFILIGVVVGASFAGILGAFLAAPVLASLKVLGLYAHAKIVDRDPWAEPPVVEAVEVNRKPRNRPWRRWL
ncbi:MAG TPA: AI-2E family transporter, partial [Anaerolineae bacterium]|nr:AI-2E family transporter [Anaerolineae bacterium]